MTNPLALLQTNNYPDLAKSLGDAATVQQRYTQAALAQFNMQRANEQHGALRAFEEAKLRGDPNAANSLLRYPDLQKSVLENESTAQAAQRERIARAAQRVLHETDPARKQATYIQEIDAGHARGDIPTVMYQNLRQRPVDDEMLKGIIAQAMPLQGTEAPKYQKVGEEVDKYGQKRDLYGFVDQLRQTVNPPRNQPSSVGGHVGAPLTDLTGQTLLDSLDPGDRSQVEAILEGRQAPPSPNARNARTQKIMEWVAQADPTFDMTKWKTRNETQAAYSKGPEGRNITALNTLPRHLQELYTAADDLKNVNVPLGTLMRHVTNPIAGYFSPDVEARLNRFRNAKQAVAEELGKAFHGAAAVSATEGWKGQFSDVSSDKSLKASILEAIKLATGRNEELEASYTRAMGHAPKQPFVSKSAREAFAEVEAKVKGQKPAGEGSGGPLPRITGRTQAERDAQYEAINGGSNYIDPNGKLRTKPGPARKQDHGPLLPPPGIVIDPTLP